MNVDRSQSSEERQLALLVASVSDYAIFMLDPEGRVMTWNPGAERMKGYTRDQIVGRHFSTFYTPEDLAKDHPANELRLALRDGRYEEEGWRVRKDGSTFWASVTITAVHDEQRRLTGFAKVTRDLSERKKAEESLHDAVRELRHANQELDRFATVAAHDMTDPLRTISGFAELLHRGGLTPTQAGEYAGHIQTSSLRLSDMLQSLLTYARAGRVEEPVEQVDLAAATARVVADLTGMITEHGAEVDIAIAADVTVSAGTRDVELILQNLIGNAVKFADPDSPHVRVSAEPQDGIIRVTVQDNGPGIAAADQERIFDAFECADSEPGRTGYGLGLAICQRLVERCRGTIGLESEPGRGSRFHVTLATSPPERSAEPQ